MLPLFEDYMGRMIVQHERFAEALRGLPQEGLDWIPGTDMNSMCILVVHVVGSARFWVGDVAAGIPSNRDRDSEFRASGLDEDTLVLRLTDNRTFVRGVLENLSYDDLAKVRPIPGRTLSNGELETYTVGQAILHALEHTGMHVGHAQITRQLWDQRKNTA